MKNEQNIPGVYNYCDRWCERCPFTNRCANYISSKKHKEVTDDNVFETLSDIFQETMEMIKKTVEESGEDWEQFREEANKIEIKKPVCTKSQKTIEKLSVNYYRKVIKWFEVNKDLIKAKEDEFRKSFELGIDIEMQAIKLENALEIIQWYMFFISVKIKRAFNGLNRNILSGIEDHEENPIQNDSHGSAKIAKIAIERSIAAWEVVRSFFPEQIDEILDFFIILTNLRKGILQEIPDVDKFIRPGFDA